MKTIIHVNKHNIKSNSKCCVSDRKPVLTVKDYKENRLGDTAILMCDGVEVARVVYRPENPLKCGAKVWIETKCNVTVANLVEGT